MDRRKFLKSTALVASPLLLNVLPFSVVPKFNTEKERNQKLTFNILMYHTSNVDLNFLKKTTARTKEILHNIFNNHFEEDVEFTFSHPRLLDTKTETEILALDSFEDVKDYWREITHGKRINNNISNELDKYNKITTRLILLIDQSKINNDHIWYATNWNEYKKGRQEVIWAKAYNTPPENNPEGNEYRTDLNAILYAHEILHTFQAQHPHIDGTIMNHDIRSWSANKTCPQNKIIVKKYLTNIRTSLYSTAWIQTE